MTMYRAFSLIELMVVIAIVAMLAAVAVPAYKNHLIGTRIASAMVIAEGLTQKAIEYSDKNGHFPTAVELGFSSINSYGQEIAEPEASQVFGPYYISSPSNGAWSNNSIYPQDNANCGKYGEIWFALDATKLGFSPDVATNQDAGGAVVVACDYWHYNGIISHLCYYWYGNSSSSGTDDLVPGYVNFSSPSGFALLNSNYQHMDDATCQ